MKKNCETFRERVLEFIEDQSEFSRTDAINKAVKLFKVARRTIYYWFHNREERGNLKDKKAIWSPRKINDEELMKYIQENPDKYLKEIGTHFGVHLMTVQRELMSNLVFQAKQRG